MEITGDMLVEKIDELNNLMEIVRGSNVAEKVNTTALVESFSDSQMKVYKAMNDLLMKLDRLFHANYDSAVASVIYHNLSRITADARIRTDYLNDVDKRAAKLEYESDTLELLKQAENLKNSIVGLHMYIVASGKGDMIPDSVYKKNEKGEFILSKTTGEKMLKLPKIPSVSDTGEIAKRGRKSRSLTLILGTVDNESGDIVWHDNDHIGKTFVNLYGTVRAEHNLVGLSKAVEKSDQSVTKGWTTPVEYAGKLWVAKLRDNSVNVEDVEDEDDDEDDDNE